MQPIIDLAPGFQAVTQQVFIRYVGTTPLRCDDERGKVSMR